MEKDTHEIGGGRCDVISSGEPRFLLLQPVDEHDLEGLEREAARIAARDIPFALAAFKIEDWNRELSPWDAPPAFGSQGVRPRRPANACLCGTRPAPGGYRTLSTPGKYSGHSRRLFARGALRALERLPVGTLRGHRRRLAVRMVSGLDGIRGAPYSQNALRLPESRRQGGKNEKQGHVRCGRPHSRPI